jgi:UDP-N-acetylmuramate: L-alanyl-gamma-D-glutamyl-meso-diaminopimelate ligase
MLNQIKTIHFIGICGTAMASVAVAMKKRGFNISGSDQNVYPPMSNFLQQNGIKIMNGYNESNLSHNPDLVIVGNSVSRGNPEVEALLNNKLNYCSLPELIKFFFLPGKRSIVVCGTHGKTTTTSIITWILKTAGFNPSYLIGGIPLNLGSGAEFTNSQWFVLEGDEYDTAFFDKRSKFVHYRPEIVVANNLEFDHADIFDNIQQIQTSFRRLFNIVPSRGLILANGDDPNLTPLLDNLFTPTKTFGLQKHCCFRATDIQYQTESTSFIVEKNFFNLPLIGEFNVRNALAAIACAMHLNIPTEIIQQAIKTFKGVKRRSEVLGTFGGRIIIDDFGHHPTAITATIQSLRIKYPEARIIVAFEPRSNTMRRNIFQEQIARSLATADAAVIASVNRADALSPEVRLDVEKLAQDIQRLGKNAVHLPTVDEIINWIILQSRIGDVVCIFSNGSFGNIYQKLISELSTNKAN